MHRAFRRGGYFVLTAIVCALTGRAQVFVPLGVAPGGGFYSQVNGISGDGSTVVGVSGLGVSDKFVWTQAAGMQALPAALSYGFIAAISGDGSTLVGGATGAYRYRSATGTQLLGTIGHLDDHNSTAWAVSGDGSVVVGKSISRTGFQAFRWTEAEGMVGIGSLPGTHPSFGAMAFGVSDDGSVIVGRSGSVDAGATGQEAFRWTANTGMVAMGDLPGGAFLSSATAVSGDGLTIVGYGTSSLGTEAFRWTATEGMVGLGDVVGGAFGSRAAAVSGDGRWIVGSGTAAAGSRAFLWNALSGTRDLQALLVEDYGLAADLSGWQLTSAVDISADGQTIVGNGINPNGQTEGWLIRLAAVAPVPEPSTYGFVAMGLLGAIAFCRRKQRL